ncbi:MAG: alcohol dehydrogenase catalytic domain-containing protein [Microbacteriaceae bacterium]|nr:alcohol dehydrogenase catalytic domain-containing protein [Microbacteriaceae bacterium]
MGCPLRPPDARETQGRSHRSRSEWRMHTSSDTPAISRPLASSATGRSSRHPPLVPGHEGVGIVEKLGEGVRSPRLDDRVAIAWLGFACGECRYCIDGRETLCEQQLDSGYSMDGASAEYAVVFARFATRVPAGITPIEAAPLSCAGVITYKALKVATIVPTERVAIFGMGGLGHLAVQYARIMGGSVVAVHIEKEKLDLAVSLGAELVVNAAEVFALHAAGRTKVGSESRRLHQVNEAMAGVLSSKVPARPVFEF